MPSFNTNKSIALSVLKHNPKQTVHIEGAPGNGKTSLAQAVFDEIGIPRDRQIIFRPSLHDPVDLLGVPHVNGDKATHWAPPVWVQNLREGAWGIIFDEFAQGVPMMQNALAGACLDRMLGEVVFSEECYIIATGNRAQDKAGSQKLVSQYSNRVMFLEQESSLHDWTEWALGAEIPLWLISGLRFKPSLLNDFDPARQSNPTERTWEMVGRLPEMPAEHLYLAVNGLVGEGAAAEICAFKEISDKLPNVDALLLNPKNADVPTDPATLFALTGALAHRAGKDTFDSIKTYADRMPPEFQVLVMKDSVKLKPEVCSTKAFIDWASKNGGVLV